LNNIRLLWCILLAVLALRPSLVPAAPFDFDNGNAPIEVVIPRLVPIIFGTVSPTASDATLVLRTTTLMTNAWFDAIAPYHPTAVGVYSRLGRRPASEGVTNRNRNIAVFYASYHVLNSLYPAHASEWRAMLLSVGLNPDDTQANTMTPTGIGNRAGKAVVAVRERDGMNQLGDEGGVKYNRQPYSDYLGYEPVNTAYDLKDPSRWQPNIVSSGNGIFRVQQFVTPQMRVTRPYSYNTPDRFNAPRPVRSNPRGPGGRQAYVEQANEVLDASANLNDERKATAELFDNKIRSLGFSILFVTTSRGLSLEQFIQLDFLTNLAAFDAAIAVWNEKHKWDAVRPFSAIRYIYGNRPVTAWGGPGKGRVTDLPASQWRSFLSTADHPEYPSGSATFCSAHAQSARQFLGTDTLGWTVPIEKGMSVVEPGITPANSITLGWSTWSDFERECGLSRLWGGVHFLSAIEAGHDLGRQIGNLAFEFVQAHIAGTAPAPAK
jgi:hypothetical protein